ncbi:ATP-binding protein [Spirillospora sp. NPDC049024]
MDYRKLPEFHVRNSQAVIHSRNNWDFESSEQDIKSCSIKDIRSTMLEIIEPNLPSKNGPYYTAGVEILGSLTIRVDISESLDSPWESGWTHLEVAPDGQMMLIVSAFAMREMAPIDFRDTIAALGSRENYQLIDISPFDDYGTGYRDEDNSDVEARRFELYFLVPSVVGSIADVIRFARQIEQEVYFYRLGIRSPKVVERIIQMGQVERLVGMRENIWLDVKAYGYEMGKNENQWKFELASDVACFANSEHGGIIVVGIATKNRSGHNEVLKKVTPVPVDETRIQRYLTSIDERVHPPVSGLNAGEVPFDDGMVVYLSIPPQLEENKPFLVQGAFWDGKYQGGAIFIPRRRDEYSIPVKAREIHTMLVAGRSLLRSGQIPPPRPEG